MFPGLPVWKWETLVLQRSPPMAQTFGAVHSLIEIGKLVIRKMFGLSFSTMQENSILQDRRSNLN